MPYVLFGMAALALGLMALGGFARADIHRLARWVRIVAGGTALAVAAGFAVRNALSYAVPLAMLGAWLLWGGGSGGGAGSAGSASARISRVATQHLEMELDLASGAMTGRITSGPLAGRDLDSLSPAQIADVWQARSFDDPASAQLLAAYLDRRHPTWREDVAASDEGPHDEPAGGGKSNSFGGMTVDDACRLLGVGHGASPDEIRRAHRRAMQGAHPDHGGSSEQAARLNAARDLLLGD